MEDQGFQLVESKGKKGNAKRKLLETIEKLEADKAALEGIVCELKKSPPPEIVEELRKENQSLEAQINELNDKLTVMPQLEGLQSENDLLKAEISELSHKLNENPQLEELRSENDSLKAQVSELNHKLTMMPQLEAIKGHQEERIAELEAEIDKLKDGQENRPAIQPAETRPVTIEEEKDELDLPCTPPTKSFARPSIGQWSVDRMKNNMSVRRLVNRMEKK